jgi:dipeptidyl aminopeptidase/acylaminoacyl peptidase
LTRRQRIEDLTTFALPSQPALSPDGREVGYVLTTVDAAADKNVTSLWRATVPVPGAGGGNARQMTRGKADSAPAWSPDGAKIAFLRADGGAAQVWALPADGGEPDRVTTLPLGAGAPVWSPDGTKIAFGAPVDLRAVPGEDDDARARRAAAPIVTTRLDYKADGTGLLRTIRKHLHVLDLPTGKVRQVTEGDWHAGDPVWSPGSARLAFGAATAPDADLSYRAPPCGNSASTRGSCGIRARHISSFSTAGRRIESTTTNGWWTGWSSTQARPSGRRSTLSC